MAFAEKQAKEMSSGMFNGLITEETWNLSVPTDFAVSNMNFISSIISISRLYFPKVLLWPVVPIVMVGNVGDFWPQLLFPSVIFFSHGASKTTFFLQMLENVCFLIHILCLFIYQLIGWFYNFLYCKYF